MAITQLQKRSQLTLHQGLVLVRIKQNWLVPIEISHQLTARSTAQ
jgi:hypothetical protein